MKRILVLILLVAPLLAAAQQPLLSRRQSKKVIGQLAKLQSRYKEVCLLDNCRTAIVTDTNYNQGLVTLNGRELLPCRYQIDIQENSPLLLVTDSLMGIVDRDGRWILPLENENNRGCACELGHQFSDGYMVYSRNGKYGAIDTLGNVIFPCTFDHSFTIDWENRLLRFFDYNPEKGAHQYVTDFDGKKTNEYISLGWFSEGLALYRYDTFYGYIDIAGREVIAQRFTHAGHFRAGVAVVEEDGRSGIIDRNGDYVFRIDSAVQIDCNTRLDNLFIVHRIDGKTSYVKGIDRHGRTLIPWQKSHIYHYIWETRSGYLVVDNDSVSLVYDGQGNRVAEFGKLLYFSEMDGKDDYKGMYVAYKDGFAGVVDTNFETVLPFIYQEVDFQNYDYFSVVMADGRRAVIDRKGNIIVEYEYDNVFASTKSFFSFSMFDPDRNGIINGYFDIYGNSTATPEQQQRIRQWIERRKEKQKEAQQK
ncbi:MAG: WG repeat-containing protein [Bacteroidales bacterium]|nr:WG repeat-containing protein [Bacteroidales bacterium]